jgi:NADH-quinone oxidoreductase subunit A
MNAYVAFLLYLGAILSVVALTLGLNRLLGPKPLVTATNAHKLEPFECGATALGAWGVRAVPIKYHALAVVFILFDLETVFLTLWVLAAQPLTGMLMATFAIFMALLALLLLMVYQSRLIERVTE